MRPTAKEYKNNFTYKLRENDITQEAYVGED